MPPKALDLPFEITSEIFLGSLPSHGRNRPAADEPPLLLAQICQQWRSVALATPELWSSIALDHSSTKTTYVGLFRADPPPRAIINLVDQWFMRAGSHPLSITMICGEEENVVAALSVYFPRCRTIELSIPTADFAGIYDISVPLPCLRKFNVHVRSKFRSPFVAFPNAPSLEELRLSALRVTSRQLKLGVASRALKRLEIVCCITTIQQCLDILENFPQLLHFSVFAHAGSLSGLQDGRTPESRIFPLQSLHIHISADANLLALITLPHLQRLTVRLLASVNSDQLLDFLSRSRANINYLHIRCEQYRCDRALELCLRAVPNVFVLRIQLLGSSDLNNIVSDQHILDQPDIFPSLRTLYIQDYEHNTLPMPQPVSLLLGRCFRALSARGVRIQVENPSFELPEDLKLDESLVAKLENDPSNPFLPLDDRICNPEWTL
ncbi:hypothetical protein C8J57DRAFT_1588657 [Mycena rebaudengoi]|nr:hypothetical protein C8J57DRAFT_1588657 [Mycena rebaudengoi]